MELVKMETLSYKLDVFEGPLDLLLTLIAKNKLNIYDIPISELLEQYMEQISRMQAENLDIASEFLEWRRASCTLKACHCCQSARKRRSCAAN